MNIKKSIFLAVMAATLASCGNIQSERLWQGQIIKNDVTIDHFPGETHSVSDMRAGIWIDGNRCEHWIIDDGVEGYMTPRFGKDSLPVCNNDNVPYTTREFNRSGWGSESKNNYN